MQKQVKDEYIPSGQRNHKPSQKATPSSEHSQYVNPMKKAIQLFRKAKIPRDYKDIAGLLLPYTEENTDDRTALKLLGFCYLVLESFEEAERLFLTVSREDDSDPEALNALAYCAISKNDLEGATRLLLDALYLDPDASLLKLNLEKIRKITDSRIFLLRNQAPTFVTITIPKESGLALFSSTIHQISGHRVFRWVGAGMILGVVAIILFITYPAILTWMENYRFKRGLGRGRVTHVSIQDIERLVAERTRYQIKLSEEEIKQKFGLIQTYLEQKSPNRAMILVNELLNSNASERVKERVLFLKDFIPEPGSDSIDYSPPVQEVIRTPFLYENVIVRWSGMIANLDHRDRKETAFDLLINFVEQAVVEGIAEVHFDGFQRVVAGEKVAIVGRVTGIGLDNKVIVIGKEIQRLGR